MPPGSGTGATKSVTVRTPAPPVSSKLPTLKPITSPKETRDDNGAAFTVGIGQGKELARKKIARILEAWVVEGRKDITELQQASGSSCDGEIGSAGETAAIICTRSRPTSWSPGKTRSHWGEIHPYSRE